MPILVLYHFDKRRPIVISIIKIWDLIVIIRMLVFYPFIL